MTRIILFVFVIARTLIVLNSSFRATYIYKAFSVSHRSLDLAIFYLDNIHGLQRNVSSQVDLLFINGSSC